MAIKIGGDEPVGTEVCLLAGTRHDANLNAAKVNLLLTA
jgi:hypothetical protein